MAAKILSPLRRLWWKSNDECLLENNVIALQEVSLEVANKDFIKKRDSKQTAEEPSHINTVDTSTANDITSIELHEDQCESTESTETATKHPVAKTKVAFLGIILCIISSLFISLTALMIKLADSIPTLEVTFIRLTLQLVFSLPPMIFFKDKFIHPWDKSKFLLLRGVTGATGMALSIYAVKHMPSWQIKG